MTSDWMTVLRMALWADLDASMYRVFDAHARLAQLAEHVRPEDRQALWDRLVKTSGGFDA